MPVGVFVLLKSNFSLERSDVFMPEWICVFKSEINFLGFLIVLVFPFFLVFFEFPRTMFAATLATISAFQMIFFGKDDITFWGKIVIFFIKLVGEGHSANFVKLIDLLYNDLYFGWLISR